ncbi:hypothetical protein GOODEAATRI_034357 [Goodea atripinnis]|uniref:Uncharacterized protein n=1 Tax=Goodea atripinnis TaxID=208336 RepID=A0ABV0NFZ5_9TELE
MDEVQVLQKVKASDLSGTRTLIQEVSLDFINDFISFPPGSDPSRETLQCAFTRTIRGPVPDCVEVFKEKTSQDQLGIISLTDSIREEGPFNVVFQSSPERHQYSLVHLKPEPVLIKWFPSSDTGSRNDPVTFIPSI